MRTTRNKYKGVGTNLMFRMLKKLQSAVGQGILHVLDWGYANAWTIEWMRHFDRTAEAARLSSWLESDRRSGKITS